MIDNIYIWRKIMMISLISLICQLFVETSLYWYILYASEHKFSNSCFPIVSFKANLGRKKYWATYICTFFFIIQTLTRFSPNFCARRKALFPIEPRQYKNDSMISKGMLNSKLPRLFPSLYRRGKKCGNFKTIIFLGSIESFLYLILSKLKFSLIRKLLCFIIIAQIFFW